MLVLAFGTTDNTFLPTAPCQFFKKVHQRPISSLGNPYLSTDSSVVLDMTWFSLENVEIKNGALVYFHFPFGIKHSKLVNM